MSLLLLTMLVKQFDTFVCILQVEQINVMMLLETRISHCQGKNI